MNQTETNDQERYERAKQRVEVLRGFYVHAIVFTIVNVGLAAYNLAMTRTASGSSTCLAAGASASIAHGVYALGSGRFLGEAWQEREDPRGDGSRATAFALIDASGEHLTLT